MAVLALAALLGLVHAAAAAAADPVPESARLFWTKFLADFAVEDEGMAFQSYIALCIQQFSPKWRKGACADQ